MNRSREFVPAVVAGAAAILATPPVVAIAGIIAAPDDRELAAFWYGDAFYALLLSVITGPLAFVGGAVTVVLAIRRLARGWRAAAPLACLTIGLISAAMPVLLFAVLVLSVR